MKYHRYLFAAFFLILPALSHAQYLEPADIDKFINHYEKIEKLITKHEKNQSEDWQNYLAAMNSFFSALPDSPDDEEQFEDFSECFQVSLNCPVPQKLEKLFEAAGWTGDGQYRWFTIFIGGTFSFFLQSDFGKDEPEQAEMIRYAFGVIDQHDRDIITNSEELFAFFKTIVPAY
jgi:hypothetical protein